MENFSATRLSQLVGEPDSSFDDGVSDEEKQDTYEETKAVIITQQESSQKKKKRVKEVIVEVKEVEIDDDDELWNQEELKAINDQQDAVNSQKPNKTEGIKIDTSKIEEYNELDDEHVHSPAINIIDEFNHKVQDVRENEASTDFVPKIHIPQVKGGKQISENDHDEDAVEHTSNQVHHHITPDDYSSNEEAEKVFGHHEHTHSPDEPEYLDPHDNPAVHLEHIQQHLGNAGSEVPIENIKEEVCKLPAYSSPPEIEESEDVMEVQLVKKDENELKSNEVAQSSELDETNTPKVEQDDTPVSDPKQIVEDIDKLKRNLKEAQKLKDQGDELFRSYEYNKALSHYSRMKTYTKAYIGSEYVSEQDIDSAGEFTQLKNLILLLQRDAMNQMAEIYFNQQKLDKVIQKTTDSLAIVPSALAFLHRGKAHALDRKFENAYKDFNKGKLMFPDQEELFEHQILRTSEMERGDDVGETNE